jgi:hypothetical protein
VKKIVLASAVLTVLIVAYLVVYVDYLNTLERIHDGFMDSVIAEVNEIRRANANSDAAIPHFFFADTLDEHCQFDVCITPDDTSGRILPIVVLPSEDKTKNEFFYVERNETCLSGMPISELRKCLRPALDYSSNTNVTETTFIENGIIYTIAKSISYQNSVPSLYDYQVSAKRAPFDFVGQLASPTIVSLGAASYTPAFDILVDNTPEVFRGEFKNRTRNLTDELD